MRGVHFDGTRQEVKEVGFRTFSIIDRVLPVIFEAFTSSRKRLQVKDVFREVIDPNETMLTKSDDDKK